jgi:peptide/nickel transport system ATP-binding protein
MTIVHRPALLVADEPTSALDTVTQAEMVKLFARLNRQLSMSILYISHDLLSVASLCRRIAILRHEPDGGIGRRGGNLPAPARPLHQGPAGRHPGDAVCGQCVRCGGDARNLSLRRGSLQPSAFGVQFLRLAHVEGHAKAES